MFTRKFKEFKRGNVQIRACISTWVGVIKVPSSMHSTQK